MSSRSKKGAARRAALPLASMGNMALAARPPRRLQPLPMARQCGTCSACCVVFHVPELDKPRGEPCRFLKDKPDTRGMCGIWAAPIWNAKLRGHGEFAGEGLDGNIRKPSVCRDFRCAWLDGRVPENLYPAVSNVVIKPTGDGQKLQFFEVVPNAARTPEVDAYIDWVVARGVPVIIVPAVAEPGGPEPNRRFISPDNGPLPRTQMNR